MNLFKINDLTNMLNEAKEHSDNLVTEQESLKKTLVDKLENSKVELEENLKHCKIDLNSANEKLSESLKDYKNSITKLKTASNQRYTKLKKKFTNSVAALNTINTILFEIDTTEENLLKPLLASLTVSDKVKNQNEGVNSEASPVAVDADEPSIDYEFNENKFKEYIESKREKLENNPVLTEQIDAFKCKESELTNELEQLKKEIKTLEDKLTKTESKFKVQILKLFIYIFLGVRINIFH